MLDRQTLLRNLLPGDIFHANGSNGASLTCLVVFISETEIQARRVTTQQTYAFDRRTGQTRSGFNAIDSVAPLPLATHDVLLGLDRKSRLEWDLERIKLSEAEKQALLFVDAHYSSNPLPPESPRITIDKDGSTV